MLEKKTGFENGEFRILRSHDLDLDQLTLNQVMWYVVM